MRGISLTRSSFNNVTVDNYRPAFIPVYPGKGCNLFVAIRAFEDECGCTQLLCVDTQTLSVNVFSAGAVNYRDVCGQDSGYITCQKLQETPYLRKLNKYTQPPYVITNQGLTHGEVTFNRSAFMTVDLCPSVRPFERLFFETFIEAGAGYSLCGVPLAVTVSALWILTHPVEFQWLVEQNESQTLAITWVNHSYSHLYFPDRPLETNFLNSPGTQVDEELLGVARLLLAKGELPSVFVRLPGLVSNEAVVQRVKQLGLIPLGSNAWLAKGEAVQDSSIVLVHGNGNEHAGIELALPLLTQWTWLDMPHAFDLCC